METPNKPQASDEEGPTAPDVPVPSPSLQARSPFRPLSRRSRQAQVAEPPAAVERPSTSRVFDASPTTVAAALARAGASPDEGSLAWRAGEDSSVDVEAEGARGEGSTR